MHVFSAQSSLADDCDREIQRSRVALGELDGAMKAITLPKLYRALRDDVYEVSVEPETAARARAAIDRMLAVAAS